MRDEEKRIGECKLDGDHIVPCTALAESTAGGSFDKRKGVIQWTFINIETGKFARNLFGVRSGQYADNGVVFNYCPFCGTMINSRMEEDKTEAA